MTLVLVHPHLLPLSALELPIAVYHSQHLLELRTKVGLRAGKGELGWYWMFGGGVSREDSWTRSL